MFEKETRALEPAYNAKCIYSYGNIIVRLSKPKLNLLNPICIKFN